MAHQKLLKPSDVCSLLQITMSKFRYAVFRKQIPVIRIGRLIRIDPEDLEKWIQSQKDTTLSN